MLLSPIRFIAHRGLTIPTSLDPAIMFTPKKLLGNLGNWDSVKYCNNDPVNFVDPSGNAANFIAGAIYGAISGGVGGYYVSNNVGGALFGALIGGASGAFMPQASHALATAAVGGIWGTGTSILGQMAGNFISNQKVLKINIGAAVGSGIGGAWASHASSFMAASQFGKSLLQGTFGGGGELLGGEFSKEFGGIVDLSPNSSITNSRYEPFSGGESKNDDKYNFGNYNFESGVD